MKATRSAIPKRNGSQNDLVMTPPHLAQRIVNHFPIEGDVLDPCAGEGAFRDALRVGSDPGDPFRIEISDLHWCEKTDGTDFFQHHRHHDWIVGNPPYSQLTPWLKHSFELADNGVYLIQTTAPFFTARINAAHDADFALRELYLVDCPEEWRRRGLSFGMGLAAVWWQRGWNGPMGITNGRSK